MTLTLGGLSACCTAANQQFAGLSGLNGVHELPLISAGAYGKILPAAVAPELFLDPGCTGLSVLGPDEDVRILFTCAAGFSELLIEISGGLTIFFQDVIAVPAGGAPFLFTGEASCTPEQPYSFGGNATVVPTP
ncbi:MAG: hypothetical protein AAF907_12780 [Planctomycetota bacterium]